MKHIKYFQEFINEAVSDIESIYQKYYSDIDKSVYDKIVEADPTTVMKDNKQGVYVKWLIKLYKNKKLKLEDLYKATEYLTAFDMFKHKMVNKDIMFYQSLPELFKAVEPFLEKEETVFANDEERRLAGQFKEIYHDETYRIIIPLTLKASKYFGRDTEWCTLSTDMFKQYTEDQTPDIISPYNLYILYTDDLDERLQFHFNEREFMDIYNEEIDIDNFFEDNPKIKAIFEEHKWFKYLNETPESVIDDFAYTNGYSFINRNSEEKTADIHHISNDYDDYMQTISDVFAIYSDKIKISDIEAFLNETEINFKIKVLDNEEYEDYVEDGTIPEGYIKIIEITFSK
jgi:hypothetical protein